MRATGNADPHPDAAFVLRKLVAAEWTAGVYGLRLFMACVCIATFMMASVWILGDGLSGILSRGGTVFLGGDVAVTTASVPLEDNTRQALTGLGDISMVAELTSSVRFGDVRVAVELKGVDGAYPLHGDLLLESGRSEEAALASDGGAPPAVLVEPALLSLTGAEVGDRLRLGDQDVVIADVIVLEPDRLSTGRFMVGPRMIMALEDLRTSGLIQLGSLVDYRYRLRATDASPDDLPGAVQALQPEAGWEFESPANAGDRVLETVNRTTTFLGIAGVVALAIGLTGAWAAAKAWIQRRSRTIALYRLSGASPGMVFALHGVIIAIASAVGLAVGLGAGLAVAVPSLDLITARLHVSWLASDLISQLFVVTVVLSIGLIGTSLLALSGAARISPGAAMRSGEAPLSTDPRHAAMGGVLLSAAVTLAVLSLPIPWLAGLATLGMLMSMAGLALAAMALSRMLGSLSAQGFFGTVVLQNLSSIGPTATKSVAIGVGIVGITTIVAAQTSLNTALTGELPERVPDLVLIDVQPSQVDAIRARIETDSALGGLQADPFMRMTITAINGVPANTALVRADKSWVIEGDRSFSWTADPTGAELLAGEWWDPAYAGEPLVSPEEDLMEAFDLKPGDRITYSVLGRSFTSEVANIRKEYHRTFRPEYLLMASPEPFRNAPHSWIMSLQGETDPAIDALMRDLGQGYPNVTSIDIRRIISQVRGVVDGATGASALMALLLVIAGALSVAALVASDVDARRREALVFSLVGASRREIALVRLTEAAAVGAVAALFGGFAGWAIGYGVVTEALHVAWSPSLVVFLLPVMLGIAASVVAGLVGGLGAAPRGRGELARQLAG